MLHAAVEAGDNAKAAWLRERMRLEQANARIDAGRNCWAGVVARYRAGK